MMRNQKPFFAITVAVFLAGISVIPCAAQKKEKLTAEDVIAKHLESIGPGAARDAVRTRVLEGQSSFLLVLQSSGASGPFYFASEGEKYRSSMRFGNPQYMAEEFAFDGKDARAGYMSPGKRSPLETAVINYGELTREALFGGSLSTAWTFLRWEGKGAKVKYMGTRKFEGKEAHALDYQPKRGSGTMKITLFFDAETFRHVRSIYKVTVPRGIGATPDQSPLLREQRYTIEEIFDGFQMVDGLMLPTRWTVQYTFDGQSGTQIWEWRAQVERVQTNGELTPATFTLQ